MAAMLAEAGARASTDGAGNVVARFGPATGGAGRGAARAACPAGAGARASPAGAGTVVPPSAPAPGPAAIVTAHPDTVSPAGTPLDPRREGDTLHGPGIGDDCLGLAAL